MKFDGISGRIFWTFVTAWMLGGALSAQGAYRLSEFVSEEEFKHEVDLSAGPAIPSGNMRTSLPAGSGFGENVPQGANFGGGAKVAYRFYPLRQLYLGVTLYGQWYGYEYKYFDLSSADRVEHSGWDAYGGTLEIGTRLPTGVYGLYFTARIQAGYALLCSPRVSAIYSTPAAGDIERPILVRSYRHGLYLGGGVGVQYRFRRHWICHLGLDYAYMPTGKFGADAPSRGLVSTDDLSFKLSAFVVCAGVSYAF